MASIYNDQGKHEEALEMNSKSLWTRSAGIVSPPHIFVWSSSTPRVVLSMCARIPLQTCHFIASLRAYLLPHEDLDPILRNTVPNKHSLGLAPALSLTRALFGDKHSHVMHRGHVMHGHCMGCRGLCLLMSSQASTCPHAFSCHLMQRRMPHVMQCHMLL